MIFSETLSLIIRFRKRGGPAATLILPRSEKPGNVSQGTAPGVKGTSMSTEPADAA